MTRKRVDWTEYEQGQIYAAVLDLLRSRKVELPIATSKGRMAFLQAMRDAQVALPENRRRRHVNSLDNVTGDLRKRFIENDVLPRDVDRLKKNAPGAPKALDPRDERIIDLTNQLDASQAAIKDLDELARTLRGRIEQLESQPTPAQMVQRYIAEIIAMAFQMKDDANKPEHVRGGMAFNRPKEEIPQFEKERRNSGGAPAASTAPRLPKILIVGGGSAVDRTIRPAMHKLKDRVKFVTWADESYDALKDRAKGADYTFLLMGAVDHSAMQAVTSVTKLYQRVIGHSSDHLVNMITNWLEKEWK